MITGQEEFTERDVEVFRRYLTFCGIGEKKLSAVFRFLQLIFPPPAPDSNRYPERSTFREQRARIQAEPNPAELGAKHFRGAEQLGVSRDEDNEGGSRSFKVREVRRVSRRFGMLRGGNER